MVKVFNYSARKIEGLKAGQTLSKDLKKRIGSKATARDPSVEIDLADKALTDEGFAQFVDDLVACIKYRDADHPEGAVKLMELRLQGNKLSVASLPKLGEVIALSAGDLRELDLSNNEISIATAEQKELWQKFLKFFANCFMLKKLDLSHNKLGAPGMEILARVYIQSDVDFVESEDTAVVGNMCKDDAGSVDTAEGAASTHTNGGKENEPPQQDRKKSPNKGKTSRQGGKLFQVFSQITCHANKRSSARSNSLSSVAKAITQADMKRFACTRGLRSIPFLILANTGLTTGAAVHLASVLAIHRPREQLLSFLPGGKAPTLPDAAEECKGIIWLPNDGISPLARKLLDVAETVREQNYSLLNDEQDDEEDVSAAFGQLKLDDNDTNSKLDITTLRQKKAKLNTEFTRIAKRARIEALHREWVHSAEIWSVSLRMMTIARALLLDDKDRPKEEEEESVQKQKPDEEPIEEWPEEVNTAKPHVEQPQREELQREELQREELQREKPQREEPQREEPQKQQPRAIKVLRLLPQDHNGLRYHPYNPRDPFNEKNPYDIMEPDPVPVNAPVPVRGPFQPGSAMFDMNFPTLATSSVREAPAGPLPDIPANRPVKPPAQQGKHASSESPAQTQVPRSGKGHARPASSVPHAHQKDGWRFKLPIEAWRSIIADVARADGILDHDQQVRIIKYAADWNSVANELTFRGAEDHQQIWKFLDTVGCFTYSPLSGQCYGPRVQK